MAAGEVVAVAVLGGFRFAFGCFAGLAIWLRWFWMLQFVCQYAWIFLRLEGTMATSRWTP